MFKVAIILLVSGVLFPYLGMWFAGTFLLGNGPEPNFLPMKIASMFGFLLSAGLYYLAKMERYFLIKLVCFFVALAYPISGIAFLLFAQNAEFSTWLLTTGLFFKNCIAALVALLVFRNCRVIHDEI